MVFIIKLLDKPQWWFDFMDEFPHWYVINNGKRYRVRNQKILEVLNDIRLKENVKYKNKMILMDSMDLIFKTFI